MPSEVTARFSPSALMHGQQNHTVLSELTVYVIKKGREEKKLSDSFIISHIKSIYWLVKELFPLVCLLHTSQYLEDCGPIY